MKALNEKSQRVKLFPKGSKLKQNMIWVNIKTHKNYVMLKIIKNNNNNNNYSSKWQIV